MSYKDLEKEISGWIEAEKATLLRKVEAKAYKAMRKSFSKAKAERPPMFRPDRPVKFTKVVVLNVRYIRGADMGKLVQREYSVETLSETVAELEAIRLAKEAGYIWRGTVEIRQGA